LIFPCGSECGLEIFQALQYEKYVEVYGASSLENNPGPFVYENYIAEIVPYITDPSFIDEFNEQISSGIWVSNECFTFTNTKGSMLNLIGNKILKLATVDRKYFVLGYNEK